jgi:Lrp/AsnC family transcriptional regulator, regulator for asnA, asnC and gidA
MLPMDYINYKILEKLAENSRTPLSEIAAELNIATSTVHKRLHGLQESNVIEKFTLIVNPTSSSLNMVTAYIGIEVERDKLESVIEKLKSIDEVLEIYETLEPYDIFIKVRAKGIYELKRKVIGVLSQREGVINVSSILTTVRHKEKTTNIQGPQILNIRTE